MLLVGMTAASAFAVRNGPERTRAASLTVGADESSLATRAVYWDDELFFIGTGRASYYGKRFAGKPTANGEIFDPSAMTAAHPTLPFGTRVRVTNLSNGRTVTVRINDRGPYAGDRIIDLSREAAERLDMIKRGTVRVKLEQYP